MRIQKSRESGNLLIYSPSGRPLYNHSDGPEDDPQDEMVMTEATPTKSNQVFKSRVDDELKGLLDQMKEIMQGSTNSNVDAVLQQQFQRMEVLTTEKTKLEFENKDLKQKLSAVSVLESQLQEERSEKEKLLSDSQNHQAQWDRTFRAMEEEKKEIQGAMADLEKQMAALKTKNADAEERIQQQHTAYEEMKDSLSQENAKMMDLVEDLRKEKAEIEERAMQLEHSFETVSKQVTETSQQIESRLDEKEKALSQAKEDREELENSLAELRREMEEITHKAEVDREAFINMNEENQHTLTNLEQSVAEKDKKIGELFKQLGEKHTEVEKERSQLSSLSCEVGKLKDELSAAKLKSEQAEEEITLMKGKIEKLATESNILSDRLTEKDAAMEALAEEKTALEEEVKNLKQALSDAVNQNKNYTQLQTVAQSELEKSLIDAIAAKEDGEQKLIDAEKSLSLYQQKFTNAMDRIANLESLLKNVSDERDEVKHHIATFNEREDELRKKLWHAEGVRRAMHGKLIQLMGNIRVFVRVRPAIRGELAEPTNEEGERKVSPGDKRKRSDLQSNALTTPFHFPGAFSDTCLDDMTKNKIEVTEPPKDRGGLKDRRKTWSFAFDGVFPPESSQKQVWEATEPLVQCAVDGYNVTVFAYGQTGSGKTYTMLGEANNEGIIARAVGKLFAAKEEIEALSLEETEVKLSVELLEIYNEKVRDLLASPGSDFLKVTSQEVSGNLVVETSCKEQVLKILQHAQSRRCVKETLSNAESSRSHLIFTIHFDVKGKDGTVRKGKLNICDLAGSERLSKSGAHNQGVSPELSFRVRTNAADVF